MYIRKFFWPLAISSDVFQNQVYPDKMRRAVANFSVCSKLPGLALRRLKSTGLWITNLYHNGVLVKKIITCNQISRHSSQIHLYQKLTPYTISEKLLTSFVSYLSYF